MAKIVCEGKTISVPTGWRALENVEVVPAEYMWYNRTHCIWEHGTGADTGTVQGRRIGMGRQVYPHAVPIAPRTPRKAPMVQETSRLALESQKDKAPLDRVRIMDLMGKLSTGRTCDHVERVLGMSHQTASARIRDLVIAGKLVDSGRREKTRTGRSAICWKAVA